MATDEQDHLNPNILIGDPLMTMEPALRLLQGHAMILRALGETADAVEPLALAALAHSVQAAVYDIDQAWRSSRAATR